MYNIGSVAAVFFTGPANDFLGRRWGMFIGAAIVIIGTCVQATTKTYEYLFNSMVVYRLLMILSSGQFLAGRFVLGFGVSFCCVSAPTYVSSMDCSFPGGAYQLTCHLSRSLRWHTRHGEEPLLASTTALGTLVCLAWPLAHSITPGLIIAYRLNHSFLGYLWMRLYRWR